jgi:pyruvate formate lyase activating enzyme
MALENAFRELLPKIDLFLFDIKLTDSEKHQTYCGNDNQQILSNLGFLCGNSANVIIRVPYIPDVNNDEKQLRSLAEIMLRFPPIQYIEFMPYHKLAQSKQQRFGFEEDVHTFNTTDRDELMNLPVKMENFGVIKERVKVSGI